MHIVEFCQFLEERSKFSTVFDKTDLEHLRVAKGPDNQKYTILIKLKTSKACMEFVTDFNNRKFNQLEKEKCVVYAVHSRGKEDPESLFKNTIED